MTPRAKLRALITRAGYTMAPGAYDTLTARLVEQAGFEAVYLTGGGYSRANGYPDLGLLTLSENVRFIGLTVEAVGIPVIADADTGYGNAINVIRTVREYEKSGVAGVSHRGPGLARRNAAITRARRSSASPRWSARSTPRSIPGKTPIWSSSPARMRARSRGCRPRSTGSTPISKPAPMSALSRRRRMSRNCASSARQVNGPALVNVFEGGKTPMVPASELEAMGFRLGIYPSQTHRAAIRAAQKVLAALKEDGDTRRIEGDLATFQEREDAVGTERWRALEEKYMRAG